MLTITGNLLGLLWHVAKIHSHHCLCSKFSAIELDIIP